MSCFKRLKIFAINNNHKYVQLENQDMKLISVCVCQCSPHIGCPHLRQLSRIISLQPQLYVYAIAVLNVCIGASIFKYWFCFQYRLPNNVFSPTIFAIIHTSSVVPFEKPANSHAIGCWQQWRTFVFDIWGYCCFFMKTSPVFERT